MTSDVIDIFHVSRQNYGTRKIKVANRDSLSSWNPLSHNHYWKDPEVIQSIVAGFSMWLEVNRNKILRPSHDSPNFTLSFLFFFCFFRLLLKYGKTGEWNHDKTETFNNLIFGIIFCSIFFTLDYLFVVCKHFLFSNRQ